MKDFVESNMDAVLQFTDGQVEKIKKMEDCCDKSTALISHIELYKTSV